MSYIDILKSRLDPSKEQLVDSTSLIKVLEKIDIKSLLYCYIQLESSFLWTNFGHKGRQAGLQYKDGEDPWTSAVGKSLGNELLYSNLNPAFENTEFQKIIEKYNLKKTRLMWVGPYACYSMHQDETPRIHIPLITNENCYFVFKQGIIQHLELGKAVWVDTRKKHTFMNCSDKQRLHLVGAVEK
jgi:hypothetical protein